MFKSLKGLVAGLLAGATLGLLFSPKKGEELRKNIKAEIKGGGTGVKAVKSTAKEFGKNVGDTLQETYEDIKSNDSVSKHTKKAKSLIGKAKKIINKATDSLAKKKK